MESGEKVYRDDSLEALCSLLEVPSKTLVVYHRNPDADCIGSALGLALLLWEMGSPVCISGSDPVPDHLKFLAQGQPFRSMEEAFEAFVPDRVVSVDVASPEQLGQAVSGKVKIDLMIDHHGRGTRFADGYVDPHAAAVSEIVFDMGKIWMEHQKLARFPRGVADALYAGIAGDTGGFRFSNTTAQTYIRAAELVGMGVDSSEICRRLFASKSKAQLRAEHCGYANMRYLCGEKATLTLISLLDRERLGLREEDLGTVIDVIREIEGVELAGVIRQVGKETFRVSLRSARCVDVAAICSRFGGGGHARAAGCTLTLPNCEEAWAAMEACFTQALEACGESSGQ